MRNHHEFGRACVFLLPPSVDEWVPQRHLARFVVEVIDGLALTSMEKAYRSWGSASHHPIVLLGLAGPLAAAKAAITARADERFAPKRPKAGRQAAAAPARPSAERPEQRAPCGDTTCMAEIYVGVRTFVDKCFALMLSYGGLVVVAKISVLLPDNDARRFEAYCTARGHKKSTLVALLIREHLDREGFASQGALFEGSDKGPLAHTSGRGRWKRDDAS